MGILAYLFHPLLINKMVAAIEKKEKKKKNGKLNNLSLDSKFIDSMVELIPSRYYFPISDEERLKSSRYYQNKQGKAPKQEPKRRYLENKLENDNEEEEDDDEEDMEEEEEED